MRSKVHLAITLFTVLTTLMLAVNILAGPVPDTGQTSYYSSVIAEDSEYTINLQLFTKLDENGNELPDTAESWTMVSNHMTGLIWEVKQNYDGIQDYANPHDADNKYTWYDSNPQTNGGDSGTPGDGTDSEDFINALNASNFGGYNDWRLPNVKELHSLVDYRLSNPSINRFYFFNTVSSSYLTSTTVYQSNSWGVSFISGGVGESEKSGPYSSSRCVRAVRGGQPNSFDNFIDNGDGTVTDTSTGLMWQQDTAPFQFTWARAQSYCENLRIADYTDWRLPNVHELHSIVDYGKSDPSRDSVFSNTTESRYNSSHSYYWSSTTSVDDENSAYAVSRYVYSCGILARRHVRAVRGAESATTTTTTIPKPQGFGMNNSLWAMEGEFDGIYLGFYAGSVYWVWDDGVCIEFSAATYSNFPFISVFEGTVRTDLDTSFIMKGLLSSLFRIGIINVSDEQMRLVKVSDDWYPTNCYSSIY